MLENYEVLESIETSFLFIGKKLVDFFFMLHSSNYIYSNWHYLLQAIYN